MFGREWNLSPGRARSAAVFTFAGLALALAGFFPTAAGALPAPQDARPGLPNRIAVVGDSISAGTGTGGLPGSEQKANSWATGTNNNSIYQRILAINPSINGNTQNLAANGAEMENADDQANSLNTGTDLVTLQMGGNDLCKDTVAQMTSTSQYRTELIQFLNSVRGRAPNALILVASIPDVFNLWYVRGAPGSVNGQQSSRAGTARAFWDNIFGGFIPCRSLITNPTSTSASDTLRRNQVRQRNIELNRILEEECARVLRCRFDDWKTFDLSSNRSDPLIYNRSTDISVWGSYQGFVSPSQWGFADDDVSTVDHFHPSNAGHRKLAQGAWDAGYDYSDRSYPQLSSATLSPAPMSNGVSRTRPVVNVSWTDPSGVRGLEYRIRTDSDGVGGAWTEVIGNSASVATTRNGVFYLESRAFDINGNRSASTMTKVEYDPSRIPAPLLSGVPPRNSNRVEATIETNLEPGLNLECSLNDEPFAACGNPIRFERMSDGPYELQVRQTDGQGNASPSTLATWTVNTSAPSAPTLENVPPAVTNSQSAAITINGTPGNFLECSYGDEPFEPCTSPWNLGPLPTGENRIAVREVNLAGSTGAVTTRSWVVDIDPPGTARITLGPPLFYNQDNPVFEFEGEEDATFECRLDRASTVGSWQPCESPWTVSGATSNGSSYTFRVRQTDEAGNRSVNESFQSWSLDKTPPGRPSISGEPSGTVTAASALIAFSPSETSSTFECSTNDGAWFACQSPIALADLPEGDNSFAVRQLDRAGNRGPASTASWRIKSFTAPPFVSSGPPPLTSSRDSSVRFDGEAGGTFACSLGGSAFTPCVSPQSFESQPDGSYVLRIRQTDSLGNQSDPTSVSWRVDATPPGQPVTGSEPPAATSVANQSITFSGEANGTFACRLNGGTWTGCTSPFETGALEDGQHRVEIRQTDDAGNTGPARTVEWLLKTRRPDPPTVKGVPRGTTRQRTMKMTMSGEQGATVECSLNGAAWASCPSPLTVSDLPQGLNRIAIRQFDVAGNLSDGVVFTWTVDTVAPTIRGTVRGIRSRNATSVRSSFLKANGKPDTVEFSTARKRPGSKAPVAKSRTLGWSPSFKVKGRATVFWIRVFDPAGNASPWYAVR